MSCPDCEKFAKEGNVYWYRWGIANIGFICCEKHFLEIREKLEEKKQ